MDRGRGGGLPLPGARMAASSFDRWYAVAAVRPLRSVLSLCVLAILSALVAGACGSNNDLSVACGPTAGFWAPHCFGGVTADDLSRPLTDLGYVCAVAHGTEHSVINCDEPRPAGAQPARLGAQIDIRGRRSAWIEATACGTWPATEVQALFEAVAAAPFPGGGSNARRAKSWIDVSLDRRSHSTTIAGYAYAAGIRLGDCESLRVTA